MDDTVMIKGIEVGGTLLGKGQSCHERLTPRVRFIYYALLSLNLKWNKNRSRKKEMLRRRIDEEQWLDSLEKCKKREEMESLRVKEWNNEKQTRYKGKKNGMMALRKSQMIMIIFVGGWFLRTLLLLLLHFRNYLEWKTKSYPFHLVCLCALRLSFLHTSFKCQCELNEMGN